jgi:hypothetical protein
MSEKRIPRRVKPTANGVMSAQKGLAYLILEGGF